MRHNILRNIIFFLFLVIVANLFYLQVIRGRYFLHLSQNNSLRVISIDGPRGRILDRNGRVLAESVKSYDAAVIPQDLKNKTAVFIFLAGVLQADAAMLEKRYEKNRTTPFAPVIVAEGLSREQAITLAEGAYLYPGLMVNERYRRKYPHADIGAHALGYVGKIDPDNMQELINNGINVPDIVGYTGIEEALDEELRGVQGGREVEVNSRGREVRVISLREPASGKDVMLTIDQRIQAIAYDALADRRGAFVMLDPSTGEVLALLSTPAYDANVFSGLEKKKRPADYLADSRSPMINRAFGAAFTPGSVFKIPVSFAGLEEKKIRPTTTFDCPGYFILGNHRFSFGHAYGPQNLIEGVAHSANEYFFHIGLALGPELMVDYARRFGLGERTGIDLPYEAKGNLPAVSTRKGWFKGDTVNLSIGQGTVLVTPLQVARMLAAVENGGYVLRPWVVRSVGGVEVGPEVVRDSHSAFLSGLAPLKAPSVPQNGTAFSKTAVPNVKNLAAVRILSFRKDVWGSMQQALRSVVKMPTGTANELDIQGLYIYGKTGTAQTSPGKEDHAWFAGVVRGPQRTVSFCLFLEHGGSSHNAVQSSREIFLRLKEDGLI